MKNPTISTGKSLLIILAVLIVLPVGCTMLFGGTNPSTAPNGTAQNSTPNYRIAVLSCAEQRIKGMLKSPSTADFPWGTSKAQITLVEGTTYEVSSYVDAQNSFGAMIRSNYTCRVTYEPNTTMCETRCKLEE